MVLTNRKGDVILKKKRSARRPKPVPKEVLTSVRQHTNPFFTSTPSVPRPAPIAVTEAMKINDAGKNKAQVVPSTSTKMSKKKKAAIIGGTVGAAVGAWGLGSKVSQFVEQRRQNKSNDAFDQEMADRYKEVEPFIRKSNWETNLKNFYGPSFHEGEPEMGFGSGVMRNVESQVGTAAEEEFFDAISGTL